MTGKDIRLSRLFRESPRLFIVPMDHGITIGPIPGLRDMNGIVNQVAKGGANAVIVHKGLAKQISGSLGHSQCDLIIHLSASTSLAPDGNRKELVSSVEHAVRLGATAVSVHVNLGSTDEAKMLEDLGKVAEQCDMWGMPLLAMMYVRDGLPGSEYDPVKIQHAARVAEEVGADIIKVNYTGSLESFTEVTKSVKVPVVIAGGPKMNSTHDLLVMIRDAMQGGARGVAIGRNVFQHPNPQVLSEAIRRILDEDIDQEELQKLAAACDPN